MLRHAPDRRVSQFCPCSIETVQRLNSELIMPRLLPLLNRTFFRYAKLDLERPCPFWDDSRSGSKPHRARTPDSQTGSHAQPQTSRHHAVLLPTHAHVSLALDRLRAARLRRRYATTGIEPRTSRQGPRQVFFCYSHA